MTILKGCLGPTPIHSQLEVGNNILLECGLGVVSKIPELSSLFLDSIIKPKMHKINYGNEDGNED